MFGVAAAAAAADNRLAADVSTRLLLMKIGDVVIVVAEVVAEGVLG